MKQKHIGMMLVAAVFTAMFLYVGWEITWWKPTEADSGRSFLLFIFHFIVIWIGVGLIVTDTP